MAEDRKDVEAPRATLMEKREWAIQNNEPPRMLPTPHSEKSAMERK